MPSKQSANDNEIWHLKQKVKLLEGRLKVVETGVTSSQNGLTTLTMAIKKLAYTVDASVPSRAGNTLSSINWSEADKPIKKLQSQVRELEKK